MEKLQHIRVGFVSELNDDDELNVKTIKEITGGDSIDLRGMRETNKTIIPTASLIDITNQKPKITFSNDENDKAIINRLVNIPFKACFENNSAFENEMMELKDEIFNYIMTEGVLFDDINPLLSDEMIYERDSYINENKMDELKSYIDGNLVNCENNKEDKPLVLDDFRSRFYEHIKNKTLKYPTLTSSKFTRTCKSFGLEIKESNGKTRIYSKKWLEEEEEEEE
jgi:phage/plasmid-associated DNA primase